jgi:rod shape-determining protein MreC
LGIVLAANFLGLTFQVRSGISFPIREGLAAVFGGGQTFVVDTTRAVASWAATVRDAQEMRTVTDRLRERVARLEWELTVQRGMLERARGFTSLDAEAMDLGEPVSGEVVGISASPLDRTVTVNRGSRHGIEPDAPVMATDGLVGRVVAVGPTVSQVELLSSSTAAVAVITSESRTRGVVRAANEGETSVYLLHFVPVGQQIAAGEEVISSGLDRLFPKGLLVGRVSAVHEGAGLLLEVVIEPAVDFGTLERVFVLPRQDEFPLTPESSDGVEP